MIQIRAVLGSTMVAFERKYVPRIVGHTVPELVGVWRKSIPHDAWDIPTLRKELFG